MLCPHRCVGLVSLNGYNFFDHAQALEPDTAPNEQRLWYQCYLHSERGREGLRRDRRGLTRPLWQTWSPTWYFNEATFERTAGAFENPDFVDVAIQSYRHRNNPVPGEPAYAAIEQPLASQAPIAVPAITFDGADDGVRPPGSRGSPCQWLRSCA